MLCRRNKALKKKTKNLNPKTETSIPAFQHGGGSSDVGFRKHRAWGLGFSVKGLGFFWGGVERGACIMRCLNNNVRPKRDRDLGKQSS